jgi:hypothetical protein
MEAKVASNRAMPGLARALSVQVRNWISPADYDLSADAGCFTEKCYRLRNRYL